jgi:hypothetical protein
MLNTEYPKGSVSEFHINAKIRVLSWLRPWSPFCSQCEGRDSNYLTMTQQYRRMQEEVRHMSVRLILSHFISFCLTESIFIDFR